MKKITLITGNAGKAAQFAKHVKMPVEHIKLDLIEVQSLDLEEVLEHKVKQAYSQLKKPVVIDDTSVTFNVLGKLPGPFIKFFLTELGLENICKMLDNFENRDAQADIGLAYFDGQKLKIIVESIKGKVATKPAGESGIGWDPIFIPEGTTKTRAEQDETEYDKFSPRRKALEKMEAFLNQNYAN